MSVLFVVNRHQDWPFNIPGSAVVTARAYLTDPAYSNGSDCRLVNLCRADRYQGRGYYVSLLGEARGHQPVPDVKAIEDLQSRAHLDLIAEEMGRLAQKALSHGATDLFELDCYFGRDPAERHPELAQQLSALGRAPLLRARFRRDSGRWRLDKVVAIGISDIPPQHRAFVLGAATEYVTGYRRAPALSSETDAPRIAILWDPKEVDHPSNEEALRKLIAPAPAVGLRAELIEGDTLARLAEFDGLFIRTTTCVGQYTYEFSRRAAALGLVVIDDPDSILKCTNKVYLNALMARHNIPTPRTLMVHRDNLHEVVPTLGLPCILKQPDSGFGLGESEQQLLTHAQELLTGSELLIAQEWLPTQFDWRVCVLDRRPLFVCKYFMAPGHWQVIKRDTVDRVEGVTQAFAVSEVPEILVNTAVRGANLIGRGLYGVDLKQVGDKCYLIEINDNPNIDAGNEDQVLGDALYREVMGVFARRIAERRRVVAQ